MLECSLVEPTRKEALAGLALMKATLDNPALSYEERVQTLGVLVIFYYAALHAAVTE